MPKYVVKIEGQNFLVGFDGSSAKRGFITFQCVEASDVHGAESVAVQMLRDDQQLRAIVGNDKSDPPVMDVLEITEVESFEGIDGTGRIWYSLTPKRWWQLWRQ